ncbi:MAG: ferritin family protein [Candidatus Omnitrophica bacterium]|nr:ferritin family protein [Candidatus Omnitrophota bacterium]
MNKIAEFALDFEKRGTLLYLELASKAKNSLSKNLFYTLAQQEIEHAKRIDAFYTASGKELPAVIYKNIERIEEEIKTFFQKIKETEMPAEKNIDGYKTAMELEKEGYRAYEGFYRESKEDKERQLLEFLLNEEKKHLEAIANVYSYLSGTEDWLEQEESKVWNWMNI